VLIGWVEAAPDITMPELADRLQQTSGVTVRPNSLSRLLCRAGWRYKKSPGRAGNRARRRRQAAPALVSLDPALAVPTLAAPGVH
jgi:transposase